MRSLKTRLALISLIILLIGIWLPMFYASRMLRDDMQRLLSEQQFSAVSLTAAQLDQDFDDRLKALDKVARSITPEMMRNPAAIQKFLEDRLVFQTLFNGGAFITSADGIATASVPSSLGRVGIGYLDRDFIVHALKNGQAMIGRPVMCKKSLGPMIGIAVPIHDAQAKVIGALAGMINLSTPNFVDKVTDKPQSTSGGYLLLASPQHRLVVAASEKSRVMEPIPDPGLIPAIDRFTEGYEGSAVYVNPLGVEVLASAKRIPTAGWVMVSSTPTREAFAPIHAMQRRVLLATILLSLLTGIVVWGVTSWIVRRRLSPMIAATKALSTQVASSQRPQPLPVGGRDEIGELVAGFNRLVETLAQREEALNSSQRIAKLGSWSLDLVSGELSWSDETYRLFEMDPNQFAATYEAFLNAIHPDDRDEVNRAYRDSLANRTSYEIIHRLLMKDGRIKWVQERCISDFDESGKALRSTGTIQDITERKLLEEAKLESHERLLTVLNSLDAIVYVADMDTHEVLFVNGFVKEAFGDIVGQQCWKSLQAGQSGPCDFCTNNKLLDAAGKPSGICRWEVQNTLNGHWYDIRDRAIEWTDGRLVRLEIAIDITEKRQAEEEILRSNAELEQFSYAISHDMRQPLRMISGHLGFLERSIADRLEPDQRESFKFAIDGAKRMDSMMLGLLEYSRVGRKGEPPAWIESRAVLDLALQFLRPAITEAQAVVRIEGEWPRIFVSPDEFLRLLQNLIGNALKFRVAGRNPEVVVASEMVGKELHISVADNGVGIQPEQIGRLFQMFQRLQGRTSYEGNGIGLALCRKIVEHHHGRIWAESAGEGLGSRFCVSLPHEECEGTAQQA